MPLRHDSCVLCGLCEKTLVRVTVQPLDSREQTTVADTIASYKKEEYQMRAVIVLLCGVGAAQAQTTMPVWQEITKTHVNVASPRQYTGPVFASTCSWDGSPISTDDVCERCSLLTSRARPRHLATR
jgi:hypothetical protein